MKNDAGLLLAIMAAVVAVLFSRSANATVDSRYAGVISALPESSIDPIYAWPDNGAVLTPPGKVWDDSSVIWGIDAMRPTTLSETGAQNIKDREGGFVSIPYSDHRGYSVGYGHLLKPGEPIVPITRDEADAYFLFDVAWSEKAVADSVTVALTQNQFDALVSFCYNIGRGAFSKSTLVKKLNGGDSLASVAAEFNRWIMASNKVNDGLVARRESEYSQFLA